MRLIVLIVSMIISFASNSIVFADSETKNYKFENDIIMSGVMGSTNKYFEVDENTIIEDIKLNLVFTKSELLDVNYSTITVLVNDVPIHSQKIGKDKEYKKETTISIPKDIVKTGYNEIEIKAYKTISDKICRDDSNTANWLVIHKESNINLLYTNKKSSDLISEYKNNYMKVDEGNKLESTIVIPDDYSDSELTSAMIFSSNIGSEFRHDDLDVDINLYSQIKNKNNNIIYIGKEKNSTNSILNLLTKEEKEKLDNNCIIKNANSPFDSTKKILLIISNDEELLKNGSKLVTSKNLISNLNKDTIIINKDTDVNDIYDYKEKKLLKFKDLGYDNITLKGPFTQEGIIDVNIPKDKVLGEGSKINLNIRYAENLDFERSLATVYVNNIPIGSKRLSKENANNDKLEFNLPKELLNEKSYQIKVVFNLELLDLACVTRDADNPFAYISNESYIKFDYNANNDLNMKNYPYPFIDGEKVNDTTVVVPDKLNSIQLTQIGNIIYYMGHEIKYNNENIKFKSISNLDLGDKKSNIIVIGTPKNNKLIKDINNSLNIKFNDNYEGFKSNEKIKFIEDYSKGIVTIQFIKSPYEKNKSIMAIASTYMNDLNLSMRYLKDRELTNTLKGDSIVFDRNGNITDLNYHSKESKEAKDIEDEKNLNKESKQFIIIAGILIFTVIISTIMLALKYKKKY